jgi:hypothetical protein
MGSGVMNWGCAFFTFMTIHYSYPMRSMTWESPDNCSTIVFEEPGESIVYPNHLTGMLAFVRISSECSIIVFDSHSIMLNCDFKATGLPSYHSPALLLLFVLNDCSLSSRSHDRNYGGLDVFQKVQE